MNNLPEKLRSIDLLQGLSDEEFEKITSIAEEVDFAEESVIFRENSPAEFVYLVVDGQATLEICAPAIGCKKILTVGRGELLGWSPVLENAKFTATARALSPMKTVRLRGRDLLDLCEAHPTLGYHFMQRAALVLSKRLSATRLQLLNVFGEQMPSPTPTTSGQESA